MDFAGLPPEVNSIRMYSGPGSGPMLAAAAGWDGIAAELHATATVYQSVIEKLVGEAWLGPASAAMAAAATPYVAWLAGTAGQAEQTATQARAAAAAYEAAFTMTVPPSVIAANRALLVTLVATNVLGQNTSAIAVNEAHYGEMWAQDAAAMYGYAAASAPSADLSPFSAPPGTTNPAGETNQAAAAAHSAGNSAGSAVQTLAAHLVPAAAAVAAPAQGIGELLSTLLSAFSSIVGLDAVSTVGLAMAAGAWAAGDASTREVLVSQEQSQDIEYDILHAIELFSPLTPSRPPGAAVTGLTAGLTSAIGESVSVGKLSVPISWAATAPEIRSLSYTAPLAGSAAGAAPATSLAGMGTAFSQMGLAGMGGSALAGSVTRGRAGQPETAAPAQRTAAPAAEPPENPVTGIAAEVREFAELRDRGLITDAEYQEQKLRLLGR